MKIENKIFWSALVLVIVYTAFLLIPTGIDFSITGYVASGVLPTVGGDSGTWGGVLNSYLQQEHTSTGGHKNVTVSGSLDVDGNTNITGNLSVDSDVNITGNLTLGDKITFRLGEVIDNIVDGWLVATGNLDVTGDLNVSGEVNSTGLNVNGNTDITNNLTVGGNVNVTGNLTVSGTSVPSGWVLIESITASNDATINFTTGIDGTYDVYKIDIAGLVPATDTTILFLRVSLDGGSTWRNGTGDYRRGSNLVGDNAISTAYGSAGDSELQLSGSEGVGNVSGENLNGEIKFYKPASTSVQTLFMWDISFINNLGRVSRDMGAGKMSTLSAVNGVQFLMSSGGISSGKFHLYGMKI